MRARFEQALPKRHFSSGRWLSAGDVHHLLCRIKYIIHYIVDNENLLGRINKDSNLSTLGDSIVAKKPAHHGEQWTPAQINTLKKLAAENTPTRVMGIKLGRTPEAVQSAASQNGISLKPTNQKPYNRRPR